MKTIIYKYLNEYGAEKTIENNSVLLKTPSQFNDPFDCYYFVSKKERRRAYQLFMNYQFFKLLYDEIVIKNKQLIFGKLNTKIMQGNLKAVASSVCKNKKYKWMPDIEMYYKIAKYINQKSDSDYLEDFNKKVDEVVDKIRHSILVSCFSLRNDSILMWSHYAQSHHGACIEYEIEGKDFKAVKYSKKPKKFKLTKVFEIIFGHEFSETKIDSPSDSFLFTIEPILAKYKGWKYEKEVRCAYSLNKKDPRIHDEKDDKGNKIWLFDMPVNIKKIYIGSEASEEFAKKIKRISCGAPIIRMRMAKGKYGVAPLEKE